MLLSLRKTEPVSGYINSAQSRRRIVQFPGT